MLDRLKRAAISGSKTIGARVVLILRAPRRRSVRFAAVIPTDSASSSFPKRRFEVYQYPCCIASPSWAIGATTSEYEVPAYSPENPWLLANRICPRPELNSAPPEFFIRGSNLSAAFSPIRAISSARSASTIPLSGSASESSGHDFGCNDGSGSPAHGSGVDKRANSTVCAIKSASESRSISAVDEVAEDCPQNTLRPSRRSRELLSFSPPPSRTPAISDSALTHKTSAALAPFRFASSSAQLASSKSTAAIFNFPLLGARAADRYPVDSNRWQPDAHWHRLAILAAGPDTRVEREVISHHRDARQHVGAVADKRRALHRPSHFAVFDQVSLARGENKLAIGDVHLSAAEVHRVEAFLDRLDDVFRRRFAGEHKSVGHSGHRRMRKAFAPSVASRLHLHQPRIHSILQVAAQDSFFDKHCARGRRSFVIDIQAAASIRNRSVIDDRAKFARNLLPDSIRERRGSLAIEVAFESVPDSLVEQNPRPSAAEHYDRLTRGCVDGVDIHNPLPRRCECILAPAFVLDKILPFDASAAAIGANLAVLAVVGNHRDVQAAERLDIGSDFAFAVHDHHDLLLARERRHHIFHARIVRANYPIDFVEQFRALADRNVQRRARKIIERTMRDRSPDLDRCGRSAALIGDRAGSLRR